jgi:hypothetical protein
LDIFRPLLDTAGAARYVGLAKSTLEKLRVFGGGPPFIKARRLVRYRPDDLDVWLGERVVGSTSEVPPYQIRGTSK